MSCHFVFREAWLMNLNRWFISAFSRPYRLVVGFPFHVPIPDFPFFAEQNGEQQWETAGKLHWEKQHTGSELPHHKACFHVLLTQSHLTDTKEQAGLGHPAHARAPFAWESDTQF